MEWEPQHPSGQPTPSSSMSSHPAPAPSYGAAKAEKLPTLKQISPSPAVTALAKLTDDELRRKGVEDLVRILRRVEADYKFLLGEHGNIVKDVNRRLQIFMLETRSLKEVNQKLQDDNQELRDLCCFLDDDRQRGRKLAREWQRFGRYTASVMRSEVAVYQEKLRELEERQSELVTENMELKELCLFLDQERVRMTGDRDEGDGSSNGTITGHEDGVVSMEMAASSVLNPLTNSYPITPSSAASYIRDLEVKVHLLEEEKKLLTQKFGRNSADGHAVVPSLTDGMMGPGHMSVESDKSVHETKAGTSVQGKSSSLSNKSETVMHAMQVLQVHEELEKTPTEDEDLDGPEKAIVREMCNVVWRKLGDVGDVGSFNESSDSITEPPFMPDTINKSDVSSTTDRHYSQGVVNGCISEQPQPQMTSTPLSLATKSSNPGNNFNSALPDHFLGSSVHLLHSQRQPAFRPSQEQLSSKPLHTQGQAEQEFRGRQNSASERLGIDRSKGFPYKQFLDKQDERRNTESKHPPHIISDTGGKANVQQLPSYHHHQQPPGSSHHQQQQSLPDMAYPLQRHTEIAAKPLHQIQPSQSSAHHHFQQSISDLNTNSYPPQRPADQTTGPSDRQQWPAPANFTSSATARNQNQRHFDPQSAQLQSGQFYPHHTDLDTGASSSRNQPEAYPYRQSEKEPTYQQVKLLDAPGAGRQFQRPGPRQAQGHDREQFHEEPGSGVQMRQQNRGDNAYVDRYSTERETFQQPTSRSLSSSTLNPSNPHNQAHNLQAAKSTQNLKAAPSGFRAYPPQLSSVPTKPVLGGPQRQESASSHQQGPALRASQLPGSKPSQNRGSNPPGKRFQEQEWRQTYLDDSDTL